MIHFQKDFRLIRFIEVPEKKIENVVYSFEEFVNAIEVGLNIR
jgi:hypothetical protein